MRCAIEECLSCRGNRSHMLLVHSSTVPVVECRRGMHPRIQPSTEDHDLSWRRVNDCVVEEEGQDIAASNRPYTLLLLLFPISDGAEQNRTLVWFATKTTFAC